MSLKHIFFHESIESFDTFHIQLKEFYYDDKLCCEVSLGFAVQTYHCSQSNFTESGWGYLQNPYENLKFLNLIEILHHQN